jgi:hypothetical protein
MSERDQTPVVDEAGLRALLILMADRLAAEEPDEPMTEGVRLQLADELTEGEDPQRSALLARSILAAPGGTRSEYAQLLRTRADTLDLVGRYAAANQRCRDIGQQVGVRHCDEDPQWRAAEREAEALWKQARAAGHTAADLIAAATATP